MELPRDPFLLPLCHCGGATRLSHVEPDPVDERKSLRTYICQACGSLQTHQVMKRTIVALPRRASSAFGALADAFPTAFPIAKRADAGSD